MSDYQKAFHDNLCDLRSQSLEITIPLALAAACTWFVWGWTSSPVRSDLTRPGTWIGIPMLVVTPVLALWLKRRYVHVAAHVMVWGVLIATAAAAVALPPGTSAALLTVPVVFASALLDRRSVFAAAALATALAFWAFRGEGWHPLGAWVSLVALLMTAIAAAQSLTNLSTALAWAWHSYAQALSNEQQMRERQSDLKRALKALDEASYRLERANHMLSIARDQAEEARRLKQQFAQTISHELRTPLNIVVGFAEVMVQSPEYYGAALPIPYQRDLGIIYRNARHLQDLVNDVLDLSRIDAAQMTLVREKVPAANLVRDALGTVRSLVESRNLALLANVGPNLPYLRVDALRIRQVLFNLITNAVRFTEKGSITVRAERSNNEVVFAVEDTGVGIAPEDLECIFEEFHQADGSNRRRHEGAGLGLAISKRFVEMHGGRIWVESEVGVGSTFYFALPADAADPSLTSPQVSASALTRTADVLSSERPVLLAVTRSPSAVALLKRYVTNYRTMTVPNMEEAQHAVARVAPQIVLVDQSSEPLTDPELDRLAAEPALVTSLVMACHLPGEESLRQQLNADAYLVKPVSQESLWDALRRFGADVDHVLLVEDDRDFSRLVTRLLEDSPVRQYQVACAGTGAEAMAHLKQWPVDVVLLDLVLPDMDGSELLDRMHSHPAWAQIPVVVVSAQEELDPTATLGTTLTLAQRRGITPSLLVRCIQSLSDLTPVAAPPAPSASQAAPARSPA